MSEWQPISTAPKDRTVVDLWMARSEYRPAHRQADAYWTGFDPLDPENKTGTVGWWLPSLEKFAWEMDLQPTHWQPLPEPPK